MTQPNPRRAAAPALTLVVLAAGLALDCAAATGQSDRSALQDKPYPGPITLAVDLGDVRQRIFRVHESIPAKPGPMVLLYPKWIPGEHGPTGPLAGISGVRITADGQRIGWRRDLDDMYALNLQVPAGVDRIELEFQFLSPGGGGQFGQGVAVTDRLVTLEWNQVVLYPGGYYARQIVVQPSVTLPDGWGFACALEATGADPAPVRFKPVDLETLVDSPLIAGKNFKRIDIGPEGAPPVHLDLVADLAENLAASPEQVKQHQALVREAFALFGARHYHHYDFLFVLSDHTAHFGLEHHQSSDDRIYADFFTSPDHYMAGADLLSHEYVHSWNGKFRRPADLLAPQFNITVRDDLLWVYEGLTNYYGQVLAARSGMWSPDQFRDYFAIVASQLSHVSGRTWRPLQDTADEASVLYQAPNAWNSWRRGTDFYDEGSLIWLDADTAIREASGGARSLDDFARAFFGVDDGRLAPLAYSFEDVVTALNQVQPYDWRSFLSKRLQTTEAPAPLDGLTRGGWRLVYTEEPNALTKATEKAFHMTDLAASIGLLLGGEDEGTSNLISNVIWGSAAFDAGAAPGMKLIAVNGDKFTSDVLQNAIKSAKDGTHPIELLVDNSGVFITLKVDYHGGLKYPHLERIPNTEDRMSAIGHARAAP